MRDRLRKEVPRDGESFLPDIETGEARNWKGAYRVPDAVCSDLAVLAAPHSIQCDYRLFGFCLLPGGYLG